MGSCYMTSSSCKQIQQRDNQNRSVKNDRNYKRVKAKVDNDSIHHKPSKYESCFFLDFYDKYKYHKPLAC